MGTTKPIGGCIWRIICVGIQGVGRSENFSEKVIIRMYGTEQKIMKKSVGFVATMTRVWYNLAGVACSVDDFTVQMVLLG